MKKAYMMKIQHEENDELPPILSETSTVLLLNIHEGHQTSKQGQESVTTINYVRNHKSRVKSGVRP